MFDNHIRVDTKRKYWYAGDFRKKRRNHYDNWSRIIIFSINVAENYLSVRN